MREPKPLVEPSKKVCGIKYVPQEIESRKTQTRSLTFRQSSAARAKEARAI